MGNHYAGYFSIETLQRYYPEDAQKSLGVISTRGNISAFMEGFNDRNQTTALAAK